MRRGSRHPAVRVMRGGALVLALASLAAGVPAAQRGLLTREEALAAVFPDAEIDVERLFLTREQIARAAALAGGDAPSALVARYVAHRDGRSVGRAYIDTHRVRTKRESLLIAVDPDGRVLRVEVTAFLEPPEYRAPGRWLRQYAGRPLDDELELQRAIRPIAGATLTAVAANAAVRRVLAIDRVLAAASPGR